MKSLLMKLLKTSGLIPVILMLLLNANHVFSQTLAFPGAEGFGAYAQGGRGGDVYTVTNLTDFGYGSLRYGIQSATGPRTIVFAVSGVIPLTSTLKIDKDYITIAGQTAPGDGICLKDACLSIQGDHIIVRYIRSRLGAEAGREDDAISIVRGHNVIMDHCSASWSVDECFSCSTADEDKIDSITVQWSIISEALDNSIHSKGAHGYGALIRGCYGAKYSYHHNLFAHNRSRNPRPGNYDENNYMLDTAGLYFDFRNNVIYNWAGSYPGYDADEVSICKYNYVGNYGKPGPDSDNTGDAYRAGSKYFRAYYDDNYFFGGIPSDQWTLVRFGNWTTEELQAYKQSQPFPTGPVTTHSPTEAYDMVLNEAGASFRRDEVDARVVSEVRNGTGSIIDDESEVGGWPEYETYYVNTDTDEDGMPDYWETENGLDPDDPEDRNGDLNSDGYTNLEDYLNYIPLTVSSFSKKIRNPELMRCYPNPSSSGFTIDMRGIPGTSTIEITDMSGRRVYFSSADNDLHRVQDHNFRSGVYLIKVTQDKGYTYKQKVIIE